MIDWDDAFDNGGYVPGSADLPDHWARAATAFREAAGSRAEFDIPYGEGARNLFDLFHPDGEAAGLAVFVHGGYWRRFDKSYWSHLAAGPLAHGLAVAMPSYTLAPEARIQQITTEVAAAIAAAASRVSGPVRLIGHSAGGHLVSRMASADGPLASSERARVARVVSLSGLHDLRPFVGTKMNDDLRLDLEEAVAESPALAKPFAGLPVTFWVGAAERPEFLRQNRLAAEAWSSAGGAVHDRYEPGKNHFSVVDSLSDPESPLVTELLA
jgi:acetyl esterase/lipase